MTSTAHETTSWLQTICNCVLITDTEPATAQPEISVVATDTDLESQDQLATAQPESSIVATHVDLES
ncbi:hypothetical protein ACFXTH_015435 [Malus domestica]